MKVKFIKKENTNKRSRIFKKRKQKKLTLIRLNTLVKLIYLNYNLLNYFFNNQNIKINKNVSSSVFLEESGTTTVLLN